MNILFLRGFNNYFNRIVKKYSTLADYQSNSDSYVNFSGINFNPNDGISTVLVVGNTDQKEQSLPLDWENVGTPDYLVCYETSEGVNTIVSRWFILESERTRAGQYRLALKRDVIADNFSRIIDAPCFIEKGVVKDSTNPLLFNKESMTFNQIKQNEILLKDETKSAWIVGYLNNKDAADNTYTTSVSLNSSGNASGTYTHASGETIAGIVEAYVTAGEDLAHHPEYVTATINSSGNIAWSISWPAFASMSVTLVISYQRTIDIEIDANESASYPDAIESSDLPWNFNPSDTSINSLRHVQANVGFVKTVNSTTWRYYYCRPNLIATYVGNVMYYSAPSFSIETPWFTTDVQVDIRNNFNILSDSYSDSNATAYKIGIQNGFHVTPSVMNQIFALGDLNISMASGSPTSYNNKIIHHNNKYYRIKVGEQTSQDKSIRLNRGTSLYQTFAGYYSSTVDAANTRAGSNIWSYHDATGETYNSVQVYYYSYTLEVEELNPTIQLFVHFPPSSTRTHLDDGVYDMFCIPYDAVKFYTGGSLTSSPYYSIKTALSLSKYFGAQLYDLQLLPYCPAREFINGTNIINEKAGVENTDYFYITKTGGDVVSFGLLCSSSSGTFDLDYTLEIPEVEPLDEIINTKISNECDLYRLVSPNYSGQFEFSVAKNGGTVNGFNVDYTYRPYNPYIHVNPKFEGLYGTDWDDARGLICGGDFSLPIVNDAWTNYQLNNKNYQNIFDRQIQSMDVLNNIAKEQTQFQAVVGALTGGIGGAAGGAMAGAKAGGGYGAIAGAAMGLVGGTALGVVGGLKDEDWLRRQQEETRSYTIDMYNYQLGNIQAMPYSLTKSGSLTNNNKIFPMVEYYTCTETEKDILKDTIKYDGMTIMAISKISDFIPDSGDETMVKGRLIRLNEINDDFHIADAIYQEIQKGVYVTPGLED